VAFLLLDLSPTVIHSVLNALIAHRVLQKNRCSHGFQTALAQCPRPLGCPRTAPVPAIRPGADAPLGDRAGPRTSGALSDPACQPHARASAGAALDQRLSPQQGISAPGADDPVAGDPVRPAPGAGTEQNRDAVPEQRRAGVHHPVSAAVGQRPAQCAAGHLRAHRTRPHPLDQGLRATDEDGLVRVWRDHHRRHID